MHAIHVCPGAFRHLCQGVEDIVVVSSSRRDRDCSERSQDHMGRIDQEDQERDESEYQIRKSVNSLVDENLLEKNGNGPSTKYCVVTSSGEQLTQLQLMLDSYRKYLIER